MHFIGITFNNSCRADDVDSFYAMPCITQAVTTSSQYFAVTGGMQVSKALAEFELFAAYVDVAISGFFALHVGGEVISVNREEPAHAGAFVFQVASGLLGTAVMNHVALQFAKDEMQHVVKVYANVGSHSKRFLVVTFPAFHVPLASAGNVGELNVKFGIGKGGGYFVAQLQDGVVVAKLQNVVNPFTGLLLHQGQLIHEFGGGHKGFFADDVAA